MIYKQNARKNYVHAGIGFILGIAATGVTTYALQKGMELQPENLAEAYQWVVTGAFSALGGVGGFIVGTLKCLEASEDMKQHKNDHNESNLEHTLRVK